MRPNPVRGRWLVVVGVAVATVVVIILSYLALVRPLRTVVIGATPGLSVEPSAAPHRPEAGPAASRSGTARSSGAPGSPGTPGASGAPATKGTNGSRDIYVTGGVSVRDAWAQKCGRYDVRFWMDPGKGIAYALPLWPQANHYPPEVDFAEDNGQDRRTNYSSVHAPDGRKPINRSVRGDFTQWHTIGLEWTPGNLLFTLDGKEWATVTGSAVPIEPMTLALQSQAWYCGHNWEACPDASTPARVNLTIDWAVAYAWTG